MKIYDPGTILLDNYEIINVFKGAAGVIYSLINLNRKEYFQLPFICLKTYLPSLLRDESVDKELFVKEIETWMLLGKYDLILNAYKVVFLEERPYVILQYADSGTLLDLSRSVFDPINDSRDWAHSLSLLWQFAAGLKKIYETIDRFHGDLHLGNVFLTNGGLLLKIGDFGLTAFTNQSHEEAFNNEKQNIARIVWFLLTGKNESIDNIKDSPKINAVPKVYKKIITDYISCNDISIMKLVENHISLHRDYVFLKTGKSPLLPEEHHANVGEEKARKLNSILSGLGGGQIKFEHRQRPEHYFEESEALYWAGNKEASLTKYMEFIKSYQKSDNKKK